MICSCCNNKYDDNFTSCPYCGTAKAVSSPQNTIACPGCSSPVMPGQAMCQQCGRIDPSRNVQSTTPTMPYVGSDSSYNSANKTVRIEGASNYQQNSPYSSVNTAYTGQNTYNTANNAYQQPNSAYNQQMYSQPGTPYQQNTYGQYQQVPTNMNQYIQSMYQNPNSPEYQREAGSIKTMSVVAMIFALLFPLVTYIMFAIASSRARRIGYTGSNVLLNIALVVAVLNSVAGIIMRMQMF